MEGKQDQTNTTKNRRIGKKRKEARFLTPVGMIEPRCGPDYDLGTTEKKQRQKDWPILLGSSEQGGS